MGIKSLFYTDFRKTKQIYRREFEFEVEATLEEERVDGYARQALECVERVGMLTNDEKENLRIEMLRKLDLKHDEITGLIDTFISRSSWFVIIFDTIVRITIIVAIIAAILGRFDLVPTILLFLFVLFMISQIKSLFARISYVFAGGERIFDILLDLYYIYGEIEAVLFFADYRGLSRANDNQKIWIYTTSHKTAPI